MNNLLLKTIMAVKGWPSIVIYFFLIERFGNLNATISALAYSILYSLLAMAHDRETKLDFGLVLFWATALAERLYRQGSGNGLVTGHFTSVLYGCLFAVAYLPLIFQGEPFSTAFARRTVAKDFWRTEQFRAVNRIMTVVWSGLFLTAFLVSLAPGVWTQVVIPSLFLALTGIPFTKKFPGYYLKKLAGGSLPSPTALVAEPAGKAVSAREDADSLRRSTVAGLQPVKKAVVFLGSPRKEKGITHMLLEHFIGGMREGGIAVRTVTLADHNIRPCTGCFSCWTKTPGACIHKDDMAPLLVEILKADLIVFAQPLYTFSVPGLTKNFLDRMLPLLEPFLIENRDGSTRHPLRHAEAGRSRMVIFSVCGFPERSHFDSLRAMFAMMAKSSGRPLVGEILRPASESLRNGEEYGGKYLGVLAALHKAGLELASMGYVSTATENVIAAPLYQDAGAFRENADQFWKAWIRYESEKQSGTDLPDLHDYLRDDPAIFFYGMASLFDPEKASGFSGVYQFRLTGPDQDFHLTIRDNRCRAARGIAPESDIEIRTPWPVWKRISKGELDGREALMQGLYRATGDISLLPRLREMFAK